MSRKPLVRALPIVAAVAVIGATGLAGASASTPHDGLLDTTFGSHGRAVLPENEHGVTGPVDPIADDLAVSGGRIWVGGVQVYATDALLEQDYTMRMTSSGRPDQTFRGGKPYWEYKVVEFGGTTAIVPEPDGGAVIATYDRDCCPEMEVSFTRLTRAGSVNHAWATQGRYVWGGPGYCANERCAFPIVAGARLSDGRLRFAGSSTGCGPCDAGLLLGLDPGGSPDPAGGRRGGGDARGTAHPGGDDFTPPQLVAMAAASRGRLYFLYTDEIGPDAGHLHLELHVLRTDANGNT